MSTFEPGTVAVATVRGVPNVRVISMIDDSRPWWTAPTVEPVVVEAHEVTDVRPQIVLDLDETEGGARYLPEWLRAQARDIERSNVGPIIRDLQRIADQIEAQTKPPKPEEPTGLGAVVEDAEGVRWTHSILHPRGKWFSECGHYERTYDDIDAVKVLSEGVSDAS